MQHLGQSLPPSPPSVTTAHVRDWHSLCNPPLLTQALCVQPALFPHLSKELHGPGLMQQPHGKAPACSTAPRQLAVPSCLLWPHTLPQRLPVAIRHGLGSKILTYPCGKGKFWFNDGILQFLNKRKVEQKQLPILLLCYSWLKCFHRKSLQKFS